MADYIPGEKFRPFRLTRPWCSPARWEEGRWCSCCSTARARPSGPDRLFRSTVGDLLAVLESLGKRGLILIPTALVLFILNRWWQRRQFIRSLRMARITVAELHDLHLPERSVGRESGEAADEQGLQAGQALDRRL